LQSYLRGHSGLITSMSWSSDDSTLVTCADNGSVYEWDVANVGKRINELVVKSCSYSDVVLTSR
jgi:WD40 repeat protein